MLAYYQNLTKQQIVLYMRTLPQCSSSLTAALQYACCAEAKHIRAAFVYTIGVLRGVDESLLHPLACAIELIHTYSLLHDDLPAMDNARLRRGQLCTHLRFDEATAILCGDALQPMAFDLILSAIDLPNRAKLAMCRVLAKACGPEGMVRGQALDMAAAGKTVSLSALAEIHQKKTGALIEASFQIGYLASTRSDEKFAFILSQYAAQIGLAFQIRDDLLDFLSTPTVSGKSNSDQYNGKSTYVTLLGVTEAKLRLSQVVSTAEKLAKEIFPFEHWLFAWHEWLLVMGE